MLVEKYRKTNCMDKSILVDINKAVTSSMQLRSKKELIEQFVAQVNADTEVEEDWRRFVREQKEEDLNRIIDEESLRGEEARRFITNAFRDGTLKTTGTDIDRIMPPVSRFGSTNRAAIKQRIIERLMAFFEKYFGLL